MRITLTTSSHHSVNAWNDITYVHRTRIWHESFRPMTMDFELSYTKLLEQQHMENRWRRASAASASSNGMCLTAQVASAHTRSAKCWEGFTGMRCCAASASLGWDLMLASHGRMSVDAWVYHIHPIYHMQMYSECVYTFSSTILHESSRICTSIIYVYHACAYSTF